MPSQCSFHNQDVLEHIRPLWLRSRMTFGTDENVAGPLVGASALPCVRFATTNVAGRGVCAFPGTEPASVVIAAVLSSTAFAIPHTSIGLVGERTPPAAVELPRHLRTEGLGAHGAAALSDYACVSRYTQSRAEADGRLRRTEFDAARTGSGKDLTPLAARPRFPWPRTTVNRIAAGGMSSQTGLRSART